MAHPELSLILPLYNEGKTVCQVIPSISVSLEAAGVDYELVLVDNGSRDNTARLLEGLAKDNPHIKIVTVEVNQGYGWGIICGLKQASGDYLGFMGSDGQIAPKDVVRVYECLRDGSCNLSKVKRVVRHDGWVRKLSSLVYNWLFNIIFDVNSKDINGTPKIFSRKLLDKLSISSRDWFLDAEIMIKTKALGATVREVEINFLPRSGGESHVRVSTVFEFLKNMLYYRWGGEIKRWKKSRL